MSLVTTGDVRRLVTTALRDPDLQAVIDREEQAVIDRCGALSGSITEVHAGDGVNLYLRRPVASMTSVAEKDTLTGTATALVENTDYYVWPGEGRLERLDRAWGAVVTVVYAPRDEAERFKTAIIELVRLALERTAMKRESVAGEYSYEAPDWEEERARVLRSLGYREI